MWMLVGGGILTGVEIGIGVADAAGTGGRGAVRWLLIAGLTALASGSPAAPAFVGRTRPETCAFGQHCSYKRVPRRLA
jgi:hypothetical protein